MIHNISVFIKNLWSQLWQLDFFDQGFSFGALFLAIMLIDISIYVVTRRKGAEEVDVK